MVHARSLGIKGITGILFSIGAVSFIFLSHDPLNDVMNFLLAGNIPGTSISIGFWSTMIIATLTLLAVYYGLKSAHHRIITSQTDQQATDASPTLHEISFDQSQRSVIAAPKHESVV